MEKNIVILFEIPPVETYKRRYDYQTLIDAGYHLDICDLSGLLSSCYKSSDEVINANKDIRIISYSNRKGFKDYIKKLEKDTFIWSTFQLTAEYYWIFRLISIYKYGFICNVDYFVPIGIEKIQSRSYWTDWSVSRVKNAIIHRIPKRLIPLRKADAVITYGEGDIQRKLDNVLYDDNTVVELTNTLDYNETISTLSINKSDELDLPEDYIVFIDEYIPYHPDGLKVGIKMDAHKYYHEVESFLERLSEQMRLPVIIAAHPKADYALHNECYRGMRIIQFKTAELIKYASFVVTHLSIAISMIIVSRKPYILITTDEMIKKCYKKGLIVAQERDLEKKVINISEDISDNIIKELSEEAQKNVEGYFDRQILKYRLPLGHPNEFLSLGDIMLKAMGEIKNR